MSDSFRITVTVSDPTEGKNLATTESVDLSVAGFSPEATLMILERQGRKLVSRTVQDEYDRRSQQ